MPFTNQVTAVLLVLLTVAVNCCEWPTCIEVLVGERETEIARAAVILTLVLALLEVSATLCAVTVTLAGEGTDEGAV